MPHHLQADSTAGQRARVQTHPMLRSGILPSDELRSRLVEMSRLQVSFFSIWDALWYPSPHIHFFDWQQNGIAGGTGDWPVFVGHTEHVELQQQQRFWRRGGDHWFGRQLETGQSETDGSQRQDGGWRRPRNLLPRLQEGQSDVTG